MTTPRESMEAVARAISQESELPREMSVLLREADEASDDSDVDIPLLEMRIQESDFVLTNNTDKVGYLLDDNDNRVGRVYESEYELSIRIDLWTIEKEKYDPDILGEELRTALYPYTTSGPSKSFVDEDGNAIDDIYRFELGLGERNDEFIRNPTVRKWTQEVELWACERFTTNEDYIVDVNEVVEHG